MVPLAQAATPSAQHRIRQFDYKSDLGDLLNICANVYGGTDYMPRIIGRLAADPGVVILAAVAGNEDAGGGNAPGVLEQERTSQSEQAQHSGRVDGIICGDRRGGTVFLYGLRVREGSRGRGLGRLLMEAICATAPHQFATDLPAQASLAAAAGPLAASASTPASAQRFVVSCTVSYNMAAQRIIGRHLQGPLHQVEVWPTGPSLESYEEAAGWVRGRGVRADAPHMLDWIPGARAALAADAAAQALLPRWRRASDADELGSAVAHLLYGPQASGGGDSTSQASGLKPLLWLPMPYEVWPVESAFVQRELAAGNVWLLTAPCGAGAPGRGRGDGAAAAEEHGPGEEAVGVMLLSQFETTNRMSAGILARDSAATHAAVAHAGSLHPHFLAYTLRSPTAATAPLQRGGAAEPDGGRPGPAGVGEGQRVEASEPAPALYNATGGCGDFWVYGSTLAPPAVRAAA